MAVDVASEEAVAKVAVDVVATVKVVKVALKVAVEVLNVALPALPPLLPNDQSSDLISRLQFEGVKPCDSFS